MSTAVKLPVSVVSEAKKFSQIHNRSVPKQIQHWCEIGKIAEKNPDLPYNFIQDLLIAQAEVEAGEVTEFSFDD